MILDFTDIGKIVLWIAQWHRRRSEPTCETWRSCRTSNFPWLFLHV